MTARIDRYLWYLYDFANSIALVGIMYYYGPWVVAQGYSQWLVSLPVSISTALVLLVMPAVARRADRAGKHVRYAVGFSVVSAAALAALAVVPASAAAILAAYLIFYFCYQAGYIFYTSLLPVVAAPAMRDGVSGIGQAWGQFGNLAGVLISFAVIGMAFGSVAGERAVFLVGAVLFMIGVLAFGAVFRGVSGGGAASDEVVGVGTFRKVVSNRNVARFLCAYLLYADAMVTVSFFATLYFTEALGYDAAGVRWGGVMLLLGTIAGGAFVSRLRPSTTPGLRLRRYLMLWPIPVAVAAVATAPTIIYPAALAVGFLLSVVFALSRSYYASIVPVAERAEYFSVYVSFERAGALLGPILWSTTVALASPLGVEIGYRFAMAGVALVAFMSFPLVPVEHRAQSEL